MLRPLRSSRLPSAVRPWLLLALLCAASAGPVLAQSGEPQGVEGESRAPEERVALHAYTLRHRGAQEAAELVRPLLSSQGRVTVQADRNTLVMRDTVAALARILPALRAFDRAQQGLAMELMVVRATRTTVSPAVRSTAPPDLVRRLRKLLSYDAYELVAETELATREGDEVTYEVGAGYSVRFRVGDVLARGQVKLHDFRLFRSGSDEPMIRTNLVLLLDKTYTLGFSKSEGSPTALMVVIECRRAAEGAEAGAAEAEGGD